MNRREFIAGVTCALAPVFHLKAAEENYFPVQYRKASPYESLIQYLEPGSDDFKGEPAAVGLEQKLARMFQGKEPLAEGLASWSSKIPSIKWANFHALPDNLVRYEIATSNTHYTGLWNASTFQQVEADAVTEAKPWFSDVTGHVFGRTPSFTDQLLKGNAWWRANLDSAAGIDVYGNQGIAVADIDNDGMDEVYVCQPGGLPNRLYKFRPDGTAVDITARAGLDILDETTCALFVDLRNSGHQDLIALRATGPLLFLNRGNGTFVELPNAFRFKTPPQGSFTGMAAADYNRDGKLDLYLCCYVYFQSEDQYQYPAPYHDAQNGPPNFLFRNELTADGTGGAFVDVTEETGLNHNNNRFSFAPAWCDFTGDGWPSLYVANDFGRNNLYRNRNGRFHDEADKAGVEDVGPGMSASWFDYNSDGLPDVYISNMWTAAGQRITRDPAFKNARDNPDAYRRHTKGNSLYKNRGDGTFYETGDGEKVEMGRWAWSSGGFDFDHDGVPEILVATGMVSNEFGSEHKTDLESFFWRQVVAKAPLTQGEAPDYENGWNALNQFIRQDRSWNGGERNVFLVRQNGRYHDASGVSGLDFADDTRTFAVTDFDGDGHPDLILRSRHAPQVRAMRNEKGANKPSMAVSLIGQSSNRDAIGAKVEVAGCTQWINAGSGFLSQHTKTLYFGKPGPAKITWPSGLVQEVEVLKTGFRHTITEGSFQVQSVDLRTRPAMRLTSVVPKNRPDGGDVWLLAPIPLFNGKARQEAGFVTLYSGEPPAIQSERIDLAKEPQDVAAAYALLRRYIFEYRTGLKLPLTMLVDQDSRVRKLYGSTPTPEMMRKDLAQLSQSATLALPFAGRYYSEPHRNYFKLGAAFYWAGYSDFALPYLDEVVRLRPDNWKAILAIGRLQQESGRFKEALETFKKLQAARPDYAPGYVNAGQVLISLQDNAGAEAMFRQALKIDPDSPDASNQMGLIAAGNNDFTGARNWFQKAISIRPNDAGAINNLGVLYAKQGQTKDAIAAFQYGIKAAPDDETLYLNLGRLYVMTGERSRAHEVLERLLAVKPDSQVARKAIAELDSK